MCGTRPRRGRGKGKCVFEATVAVEDCIWGAWVLCEVLRMASMQVSPI